MMRLHATALNFLAFVLGRASGETPAERDSRMEWWREARFGMFVHWGIYSGLNESLGFNAHDHAWKSSKELIRILVDIASKGGNLLLNVGPTREGEIPQESVQRMADIGKWMERYGDGLISKLPAKAPDAADSVIALDVRGRVGSD